MLHVIQVIKTTDARRLNVGLFGAGRRKPVESSEIHVSATPSKMLQGRAIVQAVSRWLPTAAARSSGICGGQSGAGAGFLLVLRLPLPIFIPPNFLSSQSPRAGTIGELMADVPSGPSLDSTPHYAN
jgi:hypothetical protein